MPTRPTTIDTAERMDLSAYLDAQRRIIERDLPRHLRTVGTKPLRDAMRYSLLAGGKRIRPILTLAACHAVGGNQESALPFACAVEMVHTYSLIHDDLPALDDDDLRRGHPTAHIKFGEARAVLAGDALLTDAFRVISEADAVTPARRLKIVHELATAAGGAGMVAGQDEDIEAEGQDVQPATLERIHRRKTGALLCCAVRIGAIVGRASPSRLDDLTRYAKAIGLAFQITDDLLDHEGTTAVLGKRAGRDAALGKATFPAVHGVAASRRRVARLSSTATESLASLDVRADPLRALADFICRRIA